MRWIALVLLLAGCGKTTSAPPPRPSADPPPAPPPEPATRAPLDPKVGLLPTGGVAASVDEDTAFDIAEMTADDPASPRCKDMKLELAVVNDPQGLPHFKATLVNGGKSAVALVDPGDGSARGWRTPIITWKVTTLEGQLVPRELHAGCGNMNDLLDKEVFRMKPGARHGLGPWIGTPEVRPGRFLVRLVYENDPTRKRGGFMRELERMKRTTPCKVESNAVTAVVSET
jgi:hypothetical protein